MFFQAQSKNALFASNERRMNAIDRALNSYFAKNLNLPCPSDPTINETDENFGMEYLDSTGTGCAIDLMGSKIKTIGQLKWPIGFPVHTFNDTVGGISKLHFMFGGIPTKVLGLPDAYAFDEYGNKITYVVHEPVANFRKHSSDRFHHIIGYAKVQTFGERQNTSLINSITYEQAICAKNAVILFGSSSNTQNNTVGRIQKNRTIFPACNAQIMTSSQKHIMGAKDNLAYVIISHGKDGNGAFSRETTANLCNLVGAGNTLQSGNSYCGYFRNNGTIDEAMYSNNIQTKKSLSFYHGSHITTDDDNRRFDDVVVWSTYDDLIFKNNLSSILLCHPSTFYQVPYDMLFPNQSHTQVQCSTNQCHLMVAKLRQLDIDHARPILGNDAISLRIDSGLSQRCYPGGIWQ